MHSLRPPAQGVREHQLHAIAGVINLAEFHQFIETVYGTDAAKCAGACARPGFQL